MARKKIRYIGKGRQLTKVERPENFPRYYYLPGPSERERRLRGLAYFQMLQTIGMDVTVVEPETSSQQAFMVGGPSYTVFYAAIGPDDRRAALEQLRRYACGCPAALVAILDCHFPIHDPVDITTGAPDLAGHVAVLDAIPMMLDSLAAADAVTMPNPDWAAALTEIRPDINVFVLPDLLRDTDADVSGFALRFGEIVATLTHRRNDQIRQEYADGLVCPRQSHGRGTR